MDYNKHIIINTSQLYDLAFLQLIIRYNLLNVLMFTLNNCYVYTLFLGSKDCITSMPIVDNEMPMIYDPATNLTIYPNRQGHIILEYNKPIRMSCVGSHFVSPFYDPNISEITIKCIKRHKLQYNGTDYLLNRFRCLNVPVSSITVTDDMCQVVNSEIINVGFQTKNKHIILYRICFHTKKKTTLYTWYYVDVPKFRYIQNSTTKPNFIKTGTFGSLNVDAAYEKQVSRYIALKCIIVFI